ncbi:YHYH domain-containing protein [Stenotrophomonas sp. ZAC14D1_NAIMI4_6]|uniref:excalibur calcium-binding domain-containing protein n=1 Tax=Stenotrophomonas maltophilia group TaxID=995085 RepID=UPI0009A1FEA9|nr:MULTISPECIES: excalibur calcium-binding domain-containing protein [Stenotrophomonas maltophilia group]AWH37238.1 YHYH domain-containing protein [Stenotrophomonas sp. ZAC14D1_NAIMI4_6]AWH41428.1 YHYH domain-containing protein [Stenotrophomonas sp. ZAC14D1_NAIMI4_1]
MDIRTAHLAVALIALAVPLTSSAHSGGLDKNGCHTNRKTGDYHCHRGASIAPRSIESPRNNLAPWPAGSNRPFANCAEARAAGAAPVRRGEPGYGPHLDRDNDGIGCEPYRGRR